MSNQAPRIESLSAVTVITRDMPRAVEFYDALGFRRRYGSADASFTSYHVGSGYLNVVLGTPPRDPWGRVIIYVSDVDAMHRQACAAGYVPETAPADAPWRERYFHLRDPDGNELSFARPLA